MKSHIFVDAVAAVLAGGRGGNGSRSFRREKYVPRGGPDGGDGGRGGHVILRADRNLSSLLDFFYRPVRRAADGGHGRGQGRTGANGADLCLRVPCGTEVRADDDGALLAAIMDHGQEAVICRGGRGGWGNRHFVSATCQAPDQATTGGAGEEKKVRLELKLIADAGLIGWPNAGKSTLLAALSRARPKIAPYPFTTLHPLVGALTLGPGRAITLVDIPGLVQGAHRGRGLGHQFLRHVERTRALVVVIDLAGADGRDPAADYETLLDELNRHNPDLLQRPRVLVANKLDLPAAAGNLPEFIRRTGQRPLPVSARERTGLAELQQALAAALGS